MVNTTPGFHHITAIASDAQRNVDFYVGVLGLRLVKRTVNFDDPGTYHLYYGDLVGTPGTILTFFPIRGAHQGQRGTGQATVTSLAVPQNALGWWQARFDQHGVVYERPVTRFGQEVLTFFDPDEMQLELVAGVHEAAGEPWVDSPVPAEYAVQTVHSMTMQEADGDATAALLTEGMGYRLAESEGNRFRYVTGQGNAGAILDVLVTPGVEMGRVAAGSVHHIAFRAPDDAAQAAWRTGLRRFGVTPTEVKDRQYFRSIYFREPGGVLFEIATDAPGFPLDEPVESLGAALKLPPWLEMSRRELEKRLPPLALPAQEG